MGEIWLIAMVVGGLSVCLLGVGVLASTGALRGLYELEKYQRELEVDRVSEWQERLSLSLAEAAGQLQADWEKVQVGLQRQLKEAKKELKEQFVLDAGAQILGDRRLSPEQREGILEVYCQVTGRERKDIVPHPEGDAMVGLYLDGRLAEAHRTTIELILMQYFKWARPQMPKGVNKTIQP